MIPLTFDNVRCQLKKLRQQYKISKNELARVAHVALETINRVESGGAVTDFTIQKLYRGVEFFTQRRAA